MKRLGNCTKFQPPYQNKFVFKEVPKFRFLTFSKFSNRKQHFRQRGIALLHTNIETISRYPTLYYGFKMFMKRDHFTLGLSYQEITFCKLSTSFVTAFSKLNTTRLVICTNRYLSSLFESVKN